MYGVLQKKKPCTKKNDEPQIVSCPNCGEDVAKMHAYALNPMSMRNGPKPWTERKDNNF